MLWFQNERVLPSERILLQHNFISWLYICPRELRMWEIIKYMLRQVSRDKQNGQGGSGHLSKI